MKPIVVRPLDLIVHSASRADSKSRVDPNRRKRCCRATTAKSPGVRFCKRRTLVEASAHAAGLMTVMIPDLIQPDAETIARVLHVGKSLEDILALLDAQ